MMKAFWVSLPITVLLMTGCTPPPPPDSEPQLLGKESPPPIYPLEMLRQGREGKVSVVCDIEIDGTTTGCVVAESLGGRAFAQAALDYLRTARFKPRIAAGQPVRTERHLHVVTFQLPRPEAAPKS